MDEAAEPVAALDGGGWSGQGAEPPRGRFRRSEVQREPASRAEQVADTIVASVNASAATFPVMVEALVAAALPLGTETP